MVTTAFTAALLRASANGFAGLAATRLIEGHTALAAPAGFEAWRLHLRTQIGALAAAVEDGAPDRFASHARWSRDALAARDMPVAALSAANACLRDVLRESLPEGAWARLAVYLDGAGDEIARPQSPSVSDLPGASAHGQRALDYVNALVAGDEQRAVALILDALDAGQLSIKEVLAEVLVPAQRELGRLWHQGIINIADEHFGSLVTEKVLARAIARAPSRAPNGRTVVVAAVAKDAHDLGVKVVAAFFELDGWRSICLGSNTPIEDLVQFTVRYDANLVALGATLETQREMAKRTLEALRLARPGQRVLVGGAAFAGDPELWRRIGADGYADSADSAVDIARQLLGP